MITGKFYRQLNSPLDHVYLCLGPEVKTEWQVSPGGTVLSQVEITPSRFLCVLCSNFGHHLSTYPQCMVLAEEQGEQKATEILGKYTVHRVQKHKEDKVGALRQRRKEMVESLGTMQELINKGLETVKEIDSEIAELIN